MVGAVSPSMTGPFGQPFCSGDRAVPIVERSLPMTELFRQADLFR